MQSYDLERVETAPSTTTAPDENDAHGQADGQAHGITGDPARDGDISLTVVTPPPTSVVTSLIDWLDTESESDLRSYIFQTADLEERLVEVPEWKVKILVRALTGKERTTLVKDCMLKDGTMDVSKLYPALVVMSARHPRTHKPVFKPADRDMLLSKAGSVLDRLALVAAQLSGLNQTAAVDAAKN